MECESIEPYIMLTVVSYIVVQVQMGILPVGLTATLLPAEPSSISQRIARNPGRNIRADIEGHQ